MNALERNRAVGVSALAAAGIALPSLFTGFGVDDHGFRALLRAGRPAYDLFRFAPGGDFDRVLVARGGLPWWSAPDLKIHFLRALTGLSFALDDRVFGDGPFGYHLDSVVWYVGLVAGVTWLYRRLLGDTSALLAGLAFALAGGHASAYAWISARHVLLGAAPAIAAIALHVNARERTPARAPWMAALPLAVGLIASEAAVAAAAYIVAYEVAGGRDRPARNRVLALLPSTTVFAAYALGYRLGHFGARGSGGYHDPMGEPVRFGVHAVLHFPVLAADALADLPAEGVLLGALVPLVLAGLVAIAAHALLFRALRSRLDPREHAALRWLVLGAALAMLLVGGSGVPGGRLLVVPDLGLAALAGVLVRAGLARATEAPAGLAVRAGAFAVATVHFVAGPLLALHETSAIARRGRVAEEVARDVLATDDSAHVAFVVASDPLVFLYARGVVGDLSDRRICWSTLATGRTSYRLSRTGDHAFTLDAAEGPLVGGFFATFFRARDRAMSVGDEVEQCGARLRVAALEDGRATRLDVELERATPAHVVLLTWRGGHLVQTPLPAVGADAEIPWERGPADPARPLVAMQRGGAE